jgi:hypothetical protein
LLEKYNEYDLNATKQSFWRKINSLRPAYNKQYKKNQGMGAQWWRNWRYLQSTVVVLRFVFISPR